MGTELARALTDELKRRREKNKSYSLRAFAVWLDLSPSSLSEIITGKRRVSPKLALRLSSRLQLSPDRTNKVIKSVGRRVWLAKKPSQHYMQLKKDQFELIASWTHFAILSLLRVDVPSRTVSWLASKLGVSEVTALESVHRLQRLGLVDENEKNLSRTESPISTPDGITDLAIQAAHIESFGLASQAMSLFSVDERDFTSITMAINPKKIPEAKAMIRAFRDRLANVLEDEDATEAYRLSIQLFPLKGVMKQ